MPNDNLRRRWRPLKGGSAGNVGSGLWFWFKVIDRICPDEIDPYTEPQAGLIVEPTILSSCDAVLAPRRDDGNIFVDDPMNLMAGFNREQVVGQVGMAMQGCPVDTGVPGWVLTFIQVLPDCATEPVGTDGPT